MKISVAYENHESLGPHSNAMESIDRDRDNMSTGARGPGAPLSGVLTAPPCREPCTGFSLGGPGSPVPLVGNLSPNFSCYFINNCWDRWTL